jgi:hypothetical protein
MAIAFGHAPAGRLLLRKVRRRRDHRPASSDFRASDLDHIRIYAWTSARAGNRHDRLVRVRILNPG